MAIEDEEYQRCIAELIWSFVLSGPLLLQWGKITSKVEKNTMLGTCVILEKVFGPRLRTVTKLRIRYHMSFFPGPSPPPLLIPNPSTALAPPNSILDFYTMFSVGLPDFASLQWMACTHSGSSWTSSAVRTAKTYPGMVDLACPILTRDAKN